MGMSNANYLENITKEIEAILMDELTVYEWPQFNPYGGLVRIDVDIRILDGRRFQTYCTGLRIDYVAIGSVIETSNNLSAGYTST